MPSQIAIAPNIKYKETQQKKARPRESYMKRGWEKSEDSRLHLFLKVGRNAFLWKPMY